MLQRQQQLMTEGMLVRICAMDRLWRSEIRHAHNFHILPLYANFYYKVWQPCGYHMALFILHFQLLVIA